MRADKNKTQIVMARKCMDPSYIAENAKMPLQTVKNVINGNRSVRPATIGKVAKALQVDVTEIMIEEEKVQ